LYYNLFPNLNGPKLVWVFGLEISDQREVVETVGNYQKKILIHVKSFYFDGNFLSYSDFDKSFIFLPKFFDQNENLVRNWLKVGMMGNFQSVGMAGVNVKNAINGLGMVGMNVDAVFYDRRDFCKKNGILNYIFKGRASYHVKIIFDK